MANQQKLIKLSKFRTRIAPSPTGFLHIGLARTALFNYLFTKKNKGEFVLRIEDTDKERSSLESEKDIIENLKWLDILWSEGPYRQSQRLETYQNHLEKLLAEDKAYWCFCSEEELEDQRQYQMSRGEAPKYSGQCSKLDKETTKKYLAGGKASVIRFRVADRKVSFEDLIRGRLEFDAGLTGDIVIAKSLKEPLYNLAVVVDDFDMKISHVIRGEEHISNTPKQILIQEALGFTNPIYAHLPLILGSDRSKLSKRHGAVAVSEFRKQGYLPEALINFMAFLGWNPGDDREIFSLAALAKEFSFDKVQKAGAVFNQKRLDYLNGFYIRQKSIDKLTELCIPYLPKANLEQLKKIVALYQDRLKKLSEITDLTDFFFKEKLEYDRKLLVWKKATEKETADSLEKLEAILEKIKSGDWTKENLESKIMPEAEKTGDRGVILWPFRAALTGKEASAGPFEVAEILGREKTLERIKKAKGLF